MKKLIGLFVILLVLVSCKTTKNKMVASDNYTIQVEAIKDMMPSTDINAKTVYAIISITAINSHQEQWKFEEATVKNESNSYTLTSFDHTAFFEKGQKQIMTNLREIPNEIGDSFEIEVTLVSKNNKRLIVKQEKVEVMTVH